MNALARPLWLVLLVLAATAALVATSLIVVFGAPWPARAAGAIVTVLLWSTWLSALRTRMRRSLEEDGGISPPDAAVLRYNLVQSAIAVVFAFSIIAAVMVIRATEAQIVVWAATAVPAAVLIVWSWLFVRTVRAMDEMVQASSLRAVALAAGTVLTAASIWGLFEFMAGAPHVPAFLLLPAFSIVYGIALYLQGVRGT